MLGTDCLCTEFGKKSRARKKEVGGDAQIFLRSATISNDARGQERKKPWKSAIKGAERAQTTRKVTAAKLEPGLSVKTTREGSVADDTERRSPPTRVQGEVFKIPLPEPGGFSFNPLDCQSDHYFVGRTTPKEGRPQACDWKGGNPMIHDQEDGTMATGPTQMIKESG